MGAWHSCREPSLEELLDDDVVRVVIRSAGLDADAFRLQLEETARRIGLTAEARR